MATGSPGGCRRTWRSSCPRRSASPHCGTRAENAGCARRTMLVSEWRRRVRLKADGRVSARHPVPASTTARWRAWHRPRARVDKGFQLTHRLCNAFARSLDTSSGRNMVFRMTRASALTQAALEWMRSRPSPPVSPNMPVQRASSGVWCRAQPNTLSTPGRRQR